MYTISTDKIITTFRGETFSISFTFDNTFDTKEIQNGKFVFRLYTANSEKSILEKELVANGVTDTLTYSFDHADTKDLAPLTYFYDIRLISTVNQKEIVRTIIPAKKFILK